MPFSIRPATEADVPAIADIGFAGYPTTAAPRRDGTLLDTHHDTPEGRAAKIVDRHEKLQADLRRPTFHAFVAVDDGDEAKGRVVGFCTWNEPVGADSEETLPAPSNIPHAFNDILDMFLAAKKAGIKQCLPNGENKTMWELVELCIHPDYHRARLGSRLYRQGFETLGVRDHGMYFFARTPVIAFYQRMGATLLPDSEVEIRSLHNLMAWRAGDAVGWEANETAEA